MDFSIVVTNASKNKLTMSDYNLPRTPSLSDGKTVDSSERTHHPYSPSTLQSLECCSHYRSRQADRPHVRTIAGTRAHGVTETGEDDQRLGDDDAVAAAGCLDFVEERRKLLQEVASRSQADARHDGCDARPEFFQVRELKETYLPIDDLAFDDCTSTTAGYADRVLVSHDQTYVEGFDWKFGFWPVEDPVDNLQVIAYTLGLFKKYPKCQAVRFWIRQPHLDVTKSALFKRDQIPALYLRIQVVVARAREARAAQKQGDWAAANPTVPNCNFCANLGKCDKVCAFACKVGRKFHPVEIPEDITPTMLQAPDQAALGLRLAAVLKIWCEAFRRQVTDRILRREMDLPAGQKIQTMSKRELVDMAKLRTVALKYLTQAEYESTLETTFGALEDLVSEKAPRGSKKDIVEAFQRELEASGAVTRGAEFSFLRAIVKRE